MKIAQHSVVSIHYTLTDDEGTEIDSSVGGDPLNYLHGTGGIISGLEAALVGKAAGDQINATITPEEGYGVVDPELVREVPLDMLASIDGLQPGMQLQSQLEDGRTQVLTVAEVGAETATLDANHPLAGITLHFDVTVEAVREASEEEIDHGHAH